MLLHFNEICCELLHFIEAELKAQAERQAKMLMIQPWGRAVDLGAALASGLIMLINLKCFSLIPAMWGLDWL